ncbi:TolB family protein [Streptomyces sp. NPDC059104]|uniref:TolB family protein n=1 Tax=Streptomyces sp. NPDC059104 TaxID=3346729 RepID=UPI00368F173F
MSRAVRIGILTAVTALCLVLAGGYVVRTSQDARERSRPVSGGPEERPGSIVANAPGEIVFRNEAWGATRSRLSSAPLSAPDGARTTAELSCQRFYSAHGTAVCLQAPQGITGSYQAVILDGSLHELARTPLSGTPSRARVSPSGRFATWTTFVSGDSYAAAGFSTRVTIHDTVSGRALPDLETWSLFLDGEPYHSPDVNFWGVTFADDETFYLTLGTGKKTYLVRGDLVSRTLHTLRTNAECPSLSPDGTRLSFKKRVPHRDPDSPWQLVVLDLRTMAETTLAEPASVDDQVEWLDDRTVLYAKPGDIGSDLWQVPADGTGRPRLTVRAASSPVVSR